MIIGEKEEEEEKEKRREKKNLRFCENTGINKSGFREMLHLTSNIKNVFTRNR